MSAPPPAVMEAVEEIMSVYRSLPARPTIEEVSAAAAVIRAAECEEEARLEEVGRMEKPSDVPDNLFIVLQEVSRGYTRLRSQEQRREAEQVVELDRRLLVFDELIQRASKIVSGEDVGITDVTWGERELGPARVERTSLVKKEIAVVIGDSSLKYEARPVGIEKEKLSFINVASLIETSVKGEARALCLQGKLSDDVELLPLSLGKLQDITDLNLSENRIMSLPATVGQLKLLTKLDLHSNRLINLPESFGDLSNITDLDMHDNELKSIPASIGNLTSLEVLDLGLNQLSMLPESLGNCTKLKILSLETNELEELPYTIGSWSSLIELRLDFNQLKALPEALGKLECLEVLTMHYNRIKRLPTTMALLCKLKELDVSFNELESIPENLCFASSLLKLNIGSNFADLQALPRSIGNLETVEELNISNNQIRVLPDSFRFLSKLRVLIADETPLEVPPREVLKLGAQAVVQYMADLVEARVHSSQPKKKKSLWLWLCSLFRGSKTIEYSIIDSSIA